MLGPIILGSLGATALYLTYDDTNRYENLRVQGVSQTGRPEKCAHNPGRLQTDLTKTGPTDAKKHKTLLDMAEMGISYGIERAQHLNMTNLNEAYKPYSAPPQKSTHSLSEFLKHQADKNAYLEANGHPFYFYTEGVIPLSSTQQSNPNIEIPSRASIKGDRNASLANYSRVYIDSGYDQAPPNSSAKDMLLGQGEPTEYEVPHVPMEGKLNRDWNPWGPGGVAQTIFNKHNARLTHSRGVNCTHIISSKSSGVGAAARKNRK